MIFDQHELEMSIVARNEGYEDKPTTLREVVVRVTRALLKTCVSMGFYVIIS
jgi:hypothetical protein